MSVRPVRAILRSAVVLALLPLAGCQRETPTQAREPVLAAAPVGAASATELFISEYVEGSSNNKAIEIYNPTGAAVDLAAGGYSLQMYFNGSTSAGLTINLTGTVAAGDVYVVAQSSADAAILAQADQTNGAGWFNGDDAVVLRRGTTVIDVIGQIGFDPGSQWGSGDASTQDNTLRRMASVCQGDPDGSDVFDPSVEWDGFATNTFDGLGAHTANCGGGGPTELFVSEYIEGSSNNKALEIYNGTAAAVDLAAGGYAVLMYFNGSTSAGLTINLTGTVAAGDVYVVAQSSADPAILAQADQTNGAGWFNGDDAVVLARSGTAIDVIGQIGFDPGSQWGTGDASTQDNTLRRMASVCQGDPDGSDVFDPSAEWDGFATNTFDGLGAHTATCGGGGDAAPAVASTTPADGDGPVPVAADLTVEFSEPVSLGAAAFALVCNVSGAQAFTVSGGPTTWTLDPDADLPAGESCTLTVVAAEVSDVDAVDPPDAMDADVEVDFSTAGICGSAYTPAYVVQGSGASTPLNGQFVEVEGVVVSDLEGNAGNVRGFFIQDAVGDGDPATSDALFVFNGGAEQVSLGDRVRVVGRAGEFGGQTQLSSVVGVSVCATGQSVDPVDVELPLTSTDALEAVEGMLVRLPQTLYVTGNADLARFGEVGLSSQPRLWQPTQVAAPGAAALAVQAANALDFLLLDDATNTQNDDPIVFGRGGAPLSALNTLRGGDSAAGIVGVLSDAFGAYRVRPVGALGGGVPDFQPTNPRPAAPEAVGGSLKVASFNVLNYYDSFSGCTAGLTGGPVDCRGAADAFELTRQADKIVPAILGLGADVVGLIELENDGYGTPSAIADLVGRLNAVAGSGTWAFVDADAGTGQVDALGIDAIKVGLIYQPARARPVGSTATLNTTAFVNGGDGQPRNRPALAQAFEAPGGARLVVVVNHFKSKGGPCDTPDAGDLQGNCNDVRTAAARELADWLAGDPTGTDEEDVLILGDLNAYAMEDPVQALVAAGYVDLLAAYEGPQAYGFQFENQWGSLDHALASPRLAAQVTGATTWAINADEPRVLDYNVEFKSPGQVTGLYDASPFRSADHDPLIVGADLVQPYAFGGFRRPLEAPPAINVDRAGSAIPVKFSLGGFFGLNVIRPGYPRSAPVACEPWGAPLGAFEPAESAGGSMLSYDDDQYVFVWQSRSEWSGQCREFQVRLDDGTLHRARFRFR